MAYRLGLLTIHDPDLSTLEIPGDGFAAAGELVTLVANPTVQSRLGLTHEEIRQVRDIVETYRQEVADAYATGEWMPPHRNPAVQRARATAESKIATLLGPGRAQRLKEASWRIRKADALLDDEVADALGLSQEQRRQLREVMDSNESGKTEVFQEIAPLRLQTQQDLQARGRRAEEAGAERLLAVLTEQQRQEFEELLREQPGKGP